MLKRCIKNCSIVYKTRIFHIYKRRRVVLKGGAVASQKISRYGTFFLLNWRYVIPPFQVHRSRRMQWVKPLTHVKYCGYWLRAISREKFSLTICTLHNRTMQNAIFNQTSFELQMCLKKFLLWQKS